MKKLKILLFLSLIISIFIVGCQKQKAKDVSVKTVMESMIDFSDFSLGIKEDIKDQQVAQRYGINPKDVSEGIVYYSGEDTKADKIILIKAENKDSVENIERALGAEVIGLTDSWQDNQEESRKIEKHILKTKDIFVFLYVGNNPKKMEEIFDNML